MKKNTPQQFHLTSLIMAAASLVVLASCTSIEEIAPPIQGRALSSADQSTNVNININTTTNPSNYSITQLEQGRQIYLNECIACHGPRPINEHSLQKWDQIIIRMAPESNLNQNQTTALKNYITVAHNILAVPTTTTTTNP